MSGSIDIGIPSSSRIDGSQSRVPRSMSIVRLAFVTSVACTPPVRCHSSHESIVPNASSAGSRSTWSRIQRSFSALE